jgi:hypothetical protein
MQHEMKQQYRKFKRGWGVYHVFDNATGLSKSLDTRSRQEADLLIHSMNEAQRQPLLNRQIARAYLMASDPAALTRTWQLVMEEKVQTAKGRTQDRWKSAIRDRAFDQIRKLTVVETRAEHFLDALQAGTVSTNVFLRKLHNFALDMNWLKAPVIVRPQWPRFRYKEKRAITWEEHLRIVERETNPERRAFYWVCWHLGGAQTDMALLRADNIDWKDKVLNYARCKTSEMDQIHIGPQLEAVLRERSATGPLFPYLASVREKDRATEFHQRCQGLSIKGVTLHSYRYAWAQRAKTAGYPERWAQQALGHGSKAVHRAYARKAEMRLPSLESYEPALGKVIPFNPPTSEGPATPEPPAAPVEPVVPVAAG